MCFRNVSVCGFLAFRPVKELLDVAGQTIMNVWCGCPHFMTISTICTEIDPLYENDIPHEVI